MTMYGVLMGLFIAIHYSYTTGTGIMEDKVLLRGKSTLRTISNVYIRILLIGSDKYKDNSIYDFLETSAVTVLQDYYCPMKYTTNVQFTYSGRSPIGIADFFKEHSTYVYVNPYRYKRNALFQSNIDFSMEDWSKFSGQYDTAWLVYDEKLTLFIEYVWHPNIHCVVDKDKNEPIFETSAGFYGRIYHVLGLALKMLNKIHILDHAIRIGVLAINKFKGVIWLFALIWIISWKQKVDVLETKEHQSKALPGILNKAASFEHKSFQLQKMKIENDKRMIEINEQILSILHHLDNEMNIRERKRPHSSI